MTEAVAAVDLGATSGRVMLGYVGPNELRLAPMSRFPNGPVEQADGLHWNITDLFTHVRNGIASAVSAEPNIVSIAVDSWAVDYGLLASGRMIAEPFHYRDGRTSAGVAAVQSVVGRERLYAENGLQFLPFNTLYQLAEDRIAGRLERVDALLRRYDAIVLTLGIRDALSYTSIEVWETGLAGLLAEIKELGSPRLEVFVAGIHPIRSIPGYDSPLGGLADRHATVLNRATSTLCSRLSQVTFAPLAAIRAQDGERYRSPADYTSWGKQLAETMAPAMDAYWLAVVSDPGFPAASLSDSSTDARQRAVEALTLGADGTDRRLNHVVEVTRRVFGTQIALFTVLDNDRQRHVARTGTDLTEIPLPDSFCNIAIRYRDGMVVADAREDPRFRNNPLVRGDPKARFYAGYPIESPNGERIGALCVLDPGPRAAEDVDLGLLREMALLIQRELWRPDGK